MQSICLTRLVTPAMPLYEISHATPLSESQKDRLAQAITRAHTSRFTTPSFFVNVMFIDVHNESYYVGGKRVRPFTFLSLSLSL